MIYLFMYLFFTFPPLLVCFTCFCFVAVDFVFSLNWPFFVLLGLSFFFLPLFVYFTTVFISLWVGLGFIFC